MTTSYIITIQEKALTTVKAPTLPLAPIEYQQKYADDTNNVLRLYFNKIDALISQLNVGGTGTVTDLRLPYGAFHQDGTTTLSLSLIHI